MPEASSLLFDRKWTPPVHPERSTAVDTEDAGTLFGTEYESQIVQSGVRT